MGGSHQVEQDVLGQLIRILFMVTAQVAPLHERLPLDCVQLIVEQLAAMEELQRRILI